MNTDTTNTDTVTPTPTTTEAPKRGPGRPKVTLKYPRGAFTVEELYDLNRGEKGRGKRAKVCKLTIRNHIAEKLGDGFLTEVAPVKSGKVGQPAKRYIRSAVKAALDAAHAARSTPAPTDVPPAVDIALTETPVTEAVVPPVEVPLAETAPAV